jgi:hypothetical protein
MRVGGSVETQVRYGAPETDGTANRSPRSASMNVIRGTSGRNVVIGGFWFWE